VFQATKLGQHWRDLTGRPPQDLTEEMKKLLEKLEMEAKKPTA
jgi:hypothetical protein